MSRDDFDDMPKRHRHRRNPVHCINWWLRAIQRVAERDFGHQIHFRLIYEMTMSILVELRVTTRPKGVQQGGPFAFWGA